MITLSVPAYVSISSIDWCRSNLVWRTAVMVTRELNTWEYGRYSVSVFTHGALKKGWWRWTVPGRDVFNPPPKIHKVKVKCTLVQALRLYTGRTAHRVSRGIALSFHDHGTRKGWGVSVTPRPIFTPGKEPVPIVRRLGGLQGRSGQMRKFSPHRDSNPRPSSP